MIGDNPFNLALACHLNPDSCKTVAVQKSNRSRLTGLARTVKSKLTSPFSKAKKTISNEAPQTVDLQMFVDSLTSEKLEELLTMLQKKKQG